MAEEKRTSDSLSAYLPVLKDVFGERVWFCGVQGSRAHSRDAASHSIDTASQSVDVVVILDELSAADIALYRTVMERVPSASFACGFLAGKKELLSWDPTELFHFCAGTTPIVGSLNEVASLVDRPAALRALWSGVTGIYKGTTRNMVYERSWDILETLLESAVFVMSALYFLRTGEFRASIKALEDIAEEEDRGILDICRSVRSEDSIEFDTASGTLFEWARNLLLLFPEGESEPDKVAASRG